MEELLCNRIDIDIICVSEHFIKSGNEDNLYIQNFCLAACYSRSSESRGGACILVKKIYKYKEIRISKHCVNGVIECCAVELTEFKLIILCVYRPSTSKDYDTFYDKLDIILKILCAHSNKKVVICGDFNINILKRCTLALDFEYFLRGYNLTLQIRIPTRLSSKTCIDNFAHNMEGISKTYVLEFGLSDHTAQIIEIPVKKVNVVKYWRVKKRDLGSDNLSIFKKYVKEFGFSGVYDTEDPNLATKYFLENFQMLYNLCFPVKIVTVRNINKNKWVSKGIKKCCKSKRALLWKYRKNASYENKINFKNYSKKLKKIVNLTQKAQNSHYIHQAENKSKATWQIINKREYTRNYITRVEKDGSIITDPKKIADAFNSHFINKIEYLSKNLNNKVDIQTQSQSMFLQPISPEDVIRIITTLKNKNSTGLDGICTKVVKFVKEEIAQHLSHIINMCIDAGIFPETLKTIVIKPVHKKESKLNMSNFRPVALGSIFTKIFEKYLYDALYKYLTKYNLLCDEQMGFRKSRTINMAIYKLLDIVMHNVDNRTAVCALYTDMTQAFDFVNHKRLINKLHAYGIRGNVLNLISSYLDSRGQHVEINRICTVTNQEQTYLSDHRINKFGVPQGSVLGPLLFLIYINDLPKHVRQHMVLFADDSTAVIKCNDPKEYETDITNVLRDIVEWLEINNLKINMKKSKLMQFAQRKTVQNLTIHYNGEQVDEVMTTKFLGLTIDNKLTWNGHTDNVCNKLNKCAYALFQLQKKIKLEACVVAYHGLVMPILRYGIIFWGNSRDKDIIFKAQKRCVRSMCALKTQDSCVPYFKSLKLLTFPCIYIFEICIFVKLNPHLFKKIRDTRKRKDRVRPQYVHKLVVGGHNTALLRNSVFGMAPVIYNKLPESFKDLNFLKFKKTLKLFLLDKCYYTINEFLNDNL